ncbi:CU044_5270 family protein [Streptomyces sp. NPDC049813]|uniref:CU044_5270 family protein n=1 Tax=Streptomyces sp. NPDC049813 TaxID=3365597 RepID=UPI00378957CC
MKHTPERSGRPDVMKVLADARPDALDPAALADSPRGRTELARIMAGETDARATRLRAPGRFRGGLRPLGTAAALAAVAASAVVVSTLDGNGPQGSPHSVAGGPGTSSPDGRAATSVDGRLELLSVAERAEAPAAEGTYWQTSTRSQDVDVVSAAGGEGQPFAVRSTSTEKWSVGVRPGTRSLMVTGVDAETKPRTAADGARWRAAGSPATVQAEIAGGRGGTRAYKLGDGKAPMVMRTDAGDKIYALGPRNITYRDLRELPAGRDALRRELESLYKADSGADAEQGRTAYVLRQAADLVTMPVKPAVRAAAYRVMADLPGVRGLGRVTDPLGRTGAGFTFPGTFDNPLGRVEQRLVVDGATGEMLCEQLVLVSPAARARAAGLTAGTTVNYTATTRMGWAERQITVPDDARY